MSKNWDTLIENHFAKKKERSRLTLKMLLKSVNEAMGEIPVKDEYLLTEAEEARARTYSIKQIPLPPLSELGWANNEDGGEGGTQRSFLEDWIRNIDGATLQEKLAGVSDKMENGFGDIPKTGNAEYIQKVMSYLVFIKTLTMAITNFNASAAGFNFEAFLATLMGGFQVPASGAKTITDFAAKIDEETVAISLKLYTEGQLKVDGSFFDLANDMLVPNSAWATWASQPEFQGGAIKYVVCTKDFKDWEKGEKARTKKGEKEDPLSKKGAINFYQFDISRENLFRVLGPSSDKSRKCIASETTFMEELSAWDKGGQPQDLIPFVKAPERGSKGTIEEVVKAWIEFIRKDGGLRGQLEKQTRVAADGTKAPAYTRQEIDLILTAMVEIYEETLTAQESIGKTGRLDLALNKTSLNNSLEAALEHSGRPVTPSEVVSLRDNFILSDKFGFGKFKKGLKETDAFKREMSKFDWVFEIETLITWYEDLSAEAKAIAIKNTNGYLRHTKWLIPNVKAKVMGGVPGADEPGTPFAILNIGADHVQGLLDKVRNDVMDEVFSIFDNMAEMSDELNSFFASGLKQKAKAKRGAEAGEEAAAGAREFAKQKENT